MADDLKDFTDGAPWAKDLAFKRDPNHVRDLQLPPREFSPRPAADLVPPDPATATPSLLPPQGEAKFFEPNLPRSSEPSYYNISMLKTPLWKWEIATYFFLGGVTSGAHLLGRTAYRFGGDDDITQTAAYLAFASFMPCPPLLIHDLGDPKRFHHMLRVFKPTSPMSLGTWAIMGYSGAATSEVVRQFLKDYGSKLPLAELSKLRKLQNSGTLLLVQDAVGIPMALLVMSYTGVLLSTTANPLWCKNPWLSPLFTASAVTTGAEALMLALDCRKSETREETRSLQTLRRVDTVGHLIELFCMRGFSKFAGEKAATLHTGQMKTWHKVSLIGIIGCELLKLVPLPTPLQKPRRMLSSTLGLIGGFAMRWAMVFGGHEAANDPRTARMISQASAR